MIERYPETQKDLVRRMRRVEGQARGVIRMIEEGAECEAILVQLAAMKSALNRVGLKALGCRVGTAVQEEIAQGGTGEVAVEDLLDTFLNLGS